MIKGLTREVVLALQARSGLTPSYFVWLAIAAVAALTAFTFLCVAGYDWLATLFGPVFAGLIAAGFFILCAAMAALLGALARRRARTRALLERAAHGHGASWLLDPKLLAVVMQFGRSLGWQRLIPIALLGFIAAQWARESREGGRERDE